MVDASGTVQQAAHRPNPSLLDSVKLFQYVEGIHREEPDGERLDIWKKEQQQPGLGVIGCVRTFNREKQQPGVMPYSVTHRTCDRTRRWCCIFTPSFSTPWPRRRYDSSYHIL